MNKGIFKRGIIVTLTIFSAIYSFGQKEAIDYVNVNIGSISHATIPNKLNIQLPYAMMRANVEKYDGGAPVIESLPFFVHAHRFGTPLLFNIFLQDNKSRKKFYIENEKSTPYSYEVRLSDHSIDFKFSVEKRSAIFEADFTQSPNATRILNFSDRLGIKCVSNDKKSAMLEYVAHKNGEKVKVALEFSEPFQDIASDEKQLNFKFSPTTKKLICKYGVSFISTEQASENLKREIPDFNIDKVIADGRKVWNGTLSRISVKASDENLKTKFYTAYWRTFERMHNIDEYGKYYNFFSKEAHNSFQGKYFYTDDWPWDTYRALHPLKALTEPRYHELCLESTLEYARKHQYGWFPKFISGINEMFTMNGNHIVASFIDAHKKGLKVNLEDALKHALITADTKSLLPDTEGKAGDLSAFYKENGYIPAIPEDSIETSKEVERNWAKRQAVSVTMAIAYDDWCISEMAKVLGKNEVAEKFAKRAKNYKKLFNNKTKFFEPKDEHGKFIPIKDYLRAGGHCFRYYYTEDNAYIYRFDAEHDVDDLVKMYGGNLGFEKVLDELFEKHLPVPKHHFIRFAPDHCGIMGAYAIGNEPCFRIPYLYNRAGASWKAQRILRHSIDSWFRNDLMGYPGDDDGGAMSAFVVFTMLGIYPVNIGSGEYEFGTPFFDEVELKLGNNDTKIKIKANGTSSKNRYIQNVKIDGKRWKSYSISHSDLLKAKLIEFEMGEYPNKRLFNNKK